MGNDLSDSKKILNERYQLTQKLGEGGMADVYLAQDLVLQRKVAVKVLFHRFAADSSFVERFRREAQAAANFNHPNIVAVHDYGESDGTYFIVMENVEGKTLSQSIKEATTLSAAATKSLILSVAKGLGFAHECGTIHRDVKPANILLTKTNQPKVSDFGIARAMDKNLTGLTQTGSVVGTATYFSPEQAQGKAVDNRSDLYSLGIVMFQMLNGYPPFDADSSVALALKHVQEPIPAVNSANKALSPSMVAVVERLLEKNPDDRFQNAEELIKALRDVAPEDKVVDSNPEQPATKGFIPPGSPPHTQAQQTIKPSSTIPTQVARSTPAPVNAVSQPVQQPNYQPVRNHPYQSPAANSFTSNQVAYQQQKPSTSRSSQKWVYLGVAAFILLTVVSIGALMIAQNRGSDNDKGDTNRNSEGNDILISLMADQFQEPDVIGPGITLSERESRCLAKGMVNDVGLESMVEMTDPNYVATEKEVEIFASCIDLKSLMEQTYIEGGFTEAQAKCIVGDLDEDDLEAAYIVDATGSETSSDFEEKITNATVGCLDAS